MMAAGRKKIEECQRVEGGHLQLSAGWGWEEEGGGGGDVCLKT